MEVFGRRPVKLMVIGLRLSPDSIGGGIWVGLSMLAAERKNPERKNPEVALCADAAPDAAR